MKNILILIILLYPVCSFGQAYPFHQEPTARYESADSLNLWWVDMSSTTVDYINTIPYSFKGQNGRLVRVNIWDLARHDVAPAVYTIVDSMRTAFYNSSGTISQKIKVWTGVVSISDATAQSVDISSAGFSTIIGYHVTVNDNVFNHVVVNSASTTAITLDTYNLQTTGLNILGNNVLGTASMSPSDNITGLQVSITVYGY